MDAATRLDLDSGVSVDSDSPWVLPPGLGGEVADARAPVALFPGTMDAGAASREERAALVVHTLWKPVGPVEDPFADRSPLSNCPASAVMAETLSGESVYSVDTGSCSYLTATQPTRHEVAADQTLHVRLWHFALSAPEPAEAHAAVLIDGLTVLDERVTIPQPGGLITKQLRVTRAIPAGAPVYFHLHNHGENSWSLVEISAGR